MEFKENINSLKNTNFLDDFNNKIIFIYFKLSINKKLIKKII